LAENLLQLGSCEPSSGFCQAFTETGHPASATGVFLAISLLFLLAFTASMTVCLCWLEHAAGCMTSSRPVWHPGIGGVSDPIPWQHCLPHRASA